MCSWPHIHGMFSKAAQRKMRMQRSLRREARKSGVILRTVWHQGGWGKQCFKKLLSDKLEEARFAERMATSWKWELMTWKKNLPRPKKGRLAHIRHWSRHWSRHWMHLTENNQDRRVLFQQKLQTSASFSSLVRSFFCFCNLHKL